MRKTTYLASIVFASVIALPAMAAERGGGGGGAAAGSGGHAAAAGGMGIGASVRQAALDARMNGQAVGPAVRGAARVNAQGAEYANANAISHVQGSAGQANANSVLGSGTTGGTATTTSPAAAMLSSRSGVSPRSQVGVAAGSTGATNRATARANAQGPTHASENAISHVQNSPGKANANSVLGSGSTDTGTGDTGTGDTGTGDSGSTTTTDGG